MPPKATTTAHERARKILAKPCTIAAFSLLGALWWPFDFSAERRHRPTYTGVCVLKARSDECPRDRRPLSIVSQFLESYMGLLGANIALMARQRTSDGDAVR